MAHQFADERPSTLPLDDMVCEMIERRIRGRESLILPSENFEGIDEGVDRRIEKVVTAGGSCIEALAEPVAHGTSELNSPV